MDRQYQARLVGAPGFSSRPSPSRLVPPRPTPDLDLDAEIAQDDDFMDISSTAGRDAAVDRFVPSQRVSEMRSSWALMSEPAAQARLKPLKWTTNFNYSFFLIEGLS